ncbi:MAG: FecR domain-containing protein [Elusimicrobia bacterium]|nr:FecR domain-containing protein [Elusimicrobiota bacterium]
MKTKLLILTGVALLTAASGRADDATIAALQGKVSVYTAAKRKWHRAKAGERVTLNDTVLTGGKGMAQVLFDSGARMLIKPRTRLSVRRASYGSVAYVRYGEFLIGLPKDRPHPEVKFYARTPVSVAAVTGTVFWGKSDEKTRQASWACFKGHIDVRAKGKNVTLSPGDKTTVNPNEPPAEPSPANIPSEYVRTFSLDGNLQGIDQQLQTED